jgi:hypothetical protein
MIKRCQIKEEVKMKTLKKLAAGGIAMRLMGTVLFIAIVLANGDHRAVWAGGFGLPGFGVNENFETIPDEDLLDRFLPDFKIKSVLFTCAENSRCFGIARWHVSVSVENSGGNRGIDRGDSMPLKADILQCSNRDDGDPNFTCANPRMRTIELDMYVPVAGRTLYRQFIVPLDNPHDVYVDVNVFEDGTPGPYNEFDSPYFYNNEAFLRIIWDDQRSSFIPPHRWVWPNDEDNLIY